MAQPLKASAETLAVMLVGDGLLTALQPKRHLEPFRAGPRMWRNAITFLQARPKLTVTLGLASVAVGVWLANSNRNAPQP